MKLMDNISGIHRCSICNRVNAEDIATDLGDYVSGMSYMADPNSGLHDICIECYEEIEEINKEFDYEEED
jgi:hypothetical protein